MGQAIRPDKFFADIPSLAESEGASGVTEEEKILAGLAESGGWKILREFIERVKNDLDNVNTAAISQGATFEEIGKNAVVVGLAKSVIEKIINKVLDAKEANERPQQSAGPTGQSGV